MRRLAVALMAITAACGSSEAESRTDESDTRDVERLAVRMSEHLTLLSLGEVREFIDDDLPVRAAELIEAGTLPAARRHQRTVAEEPMTSPRGERLRDEGAVLLQARVDSLEQYRAALSRGLMEDMTLLEAIQAQRAAEEAILQFMARLDAMLEEPSE